MAEDKLWFQRAVYAKTPYSLGGWHHTQAATARRRRALSSRPRNWSKPRRYLSVARALQALANVTQSTETARIAKIDANYFMRVYHRMR